MWCLRAQCSRLLERRKGKGKGGAYAVEWEGDEKHEEEEAGAACVEDYCGWGGSVIGELGQCGVTSEDVEIEDKSEKIEMIVDS